MGIRRGFFLLCAFASLALADLAAAAEPALSPAMQAYHDVSVAREKYGDVIGGEETATPDQLQQIIKELHGSLALLDEPHVHAMAEGT